VDSLKTGDRRKKSYGGNAGGLRKNIHPDRARRVKRPDQHLAIIPGSTLIIGAESEKRKTREPFKKRREGLAKILSEDGGLDFQGGVGCKLMTGGRRRIEEYSRKEGNKTTLHKV